MRPDGDDDPRVALATEASRVADRLRGLALDRLGRADAHGGAPADRARATAQRLADLSAAAAGRWPRAVPVLAPHAAGDQVAVTAADVLAEGDDATVRTALAALVALRRTL